LIRILAVGNATLCHLFSPEALVTLTLLLDLDNTLLGNDNEEFVPAYFHLLGQELAPFAAPNRLLPELLRATGKMIENSRPDCTLQEIFESVFYPAIGVESSALKAPIERFYQEKFPTLKPITRPRPAAAQLVETALSRGWQIVIATNPLFPRTAILQRLEWAGVPADRYPFRLITSYEDFHFAKPKPAYYAEILARLGWPAGPVVMVGDDPERDIAPAAALGIGTYLVNPPGHTAESHGALRDVLPWLEQMESQEPDYSQTSSMNATLWSTPAALDTLFRPLTVEAWSHKPAPKEWSPTELVCHLRDVEAEVNLPRLQKVLAETNPFLPGEDTDAWASQRRYAEQNGPAALVRFTAARLRALDLLETLSPPDWKRTARHAILGTTSLAELVGIVAAHDRLHIRQIQQALEMK
jgi:HAD superfamily hydrolase (TIGR01549 family)